MKRTKIIFVDKKKIGCQCKRKISDFFNKRHIKVNYSILLGIFVIQRGFTGGICNRNLI